MHEHSFVQSIIKQVPYSDNKTVKKIILEVGDLVGIEPEHLKEHMEEETGWEVVVEKKKSSVKCNCGYQGEAKIDQRLHDLVIFSCPSCDKMIPEVWEGKDIKIKKVLYD